MTSWVDALPAVLAAVALLVLPGGLVGLAAGLRGIPLLGLAPGLSVSVVALTAVVAGAVGAPFGTGPVLAGAGGAAVLAVGVRVVGGRLTGGRPGGGLRRGGLRGGDTGRGPAGAVRDKAGTTLAALAGTVAGGACAALAVMRGIPRVEAVPQTFDAVFHLSAVWHIVHTGQGSSLTLGTIAAPERPRASYPGAWHDVTALVVELSGLSVPIAANAVSLAVAAVVWPCGVVLLARMVLGADPAVLAVAGLLSVGFAASPYLLLSYGTLWPNALATALLPSVLACVAVVVGVAVDPPLRLTGAMVGGLGLAPGVTLAHPNATVSALLLAGVVGLVAVWRWAATGSVPWRRAATASAVTVAGVAFGAWFLADSPFFAATRRTSWPARQTAAQAMGEWLASAPMRVPVPVLLAGLVVWGAVVALRRPELRWLLACHVVAGTLFALVAGSDGPVSRGLSGAWWDDPFRLGALLGVTGAPLAALGFRAAAGLPALLWPRRAGVRSPLVVMAPLAVVVVVATGGMYAADNGRVVGNWYAGAAMVGSDERALLERLPGLVPDNAVIAGSPWNGSALAQAIGDREVLFPHLVGTWGAERAVVGSRLNQVSTDPVACEAVRRLHVGYVISGPSAFWPGDGRQRAFAGLDVAGHPGFDALDHGGRLTLYRITRCQ